MADDQRPSSPAPPGGFAGHDGAAVPGDGLFPANEPVGYRVWHKEGEEYKYVASVESNALGAILMTTHGFQGYGRWQDNPAVAARPGEHRSTDIGDVLIGRDGRSLEIAADGGLRLKPIAPVDRIPSDAKEPPAEIEAAMGAPQNGKDTVVWKDDHLFQDWPPPPPPTRERVEEQIRQLKQGTEFTTIIEHFDGPPENHFVDIRQEEKLIGRSWGDLTEGQKLGQLQVATDVMLLSPPETHELLAREVDFTHITPAEQDAYLGRPFDGPGMPAPGQQPTPIRVEPGKDNPLSWRDDRSFDIHDAGGKIGHLAGYMGGPWADGEFRVTHVEIAEPGRHLTPGEWKGVLRGLREHLPDAEYLGGNRAGEGGDLHPAYEKLVPLHPPEPAIRRVLHGQDAGSWMDGIGPAGPGVDPGEAARREGRIGRIGAAIGSADWDAMTRVERAALLERAVDWGGDDIRALLMREIDFARVPEEDRRRWLGGIYQEAAPGRSEESRPAAPPSAIWPDPEDFRDAVGVGSPAELKALFREWAEDDAARRAPEAERPEPPPSPEARPVPSVAEILADARRLLSPEQIRALGHGQANDNGMRM